VLIDHDRIGAVGKHLDTSGAAVLDGHGKSSYRVSSIRTTTCGRR
jgi:hypothetical protein